MRWLAWTMAGLGGATLFALGSCNDGGRAQVPTAPPPRAAVVALPPVVPSPAMTPGQGSEFAIGGRFTQGGWVRGLVPSGAVGLSLDGRDVSIGRDGAFFAAFDRDAGAAASLVARMANGNAVTRALAVAPRAWNIEHVAIGPRPGAAPSAEFQRRRAAELAQINAARAINAESDGWRQNFVWPVRGRISGRFGSQRIYRGTPGSYHSGMDIATGESGTPFVAPADGVVILAAESSFTLEGRLLMIDHGMGLNSAFLHCSALDVRVGDRVRQGQVIGRIGMTGRATGPHLHWSIKWRNARLDPLLFVEPL